MSRHRRPQGFQRTDRVADQIQRLLAELLLTGMKDPRLGMVTIQEVRVSRDLTWADVYFTLMGEGSDAGEQAETVLSNASGFLRSTLAKSLNTRTTPKLRFHYDRLPEQATYISSLIDRARATDPEGGSQDSSSDAQDSGDDQTNQ